MFTNRFSKIAVVLLVLAIAFVSVSFAIRSANVTAADRSYDQIESVRLDHSPMEVNKCFYVSVCEFTCPNQSGTILGQ